MPACLRIRSALYRIAAGLQRGSVRIDSLDLRDFPINETVFHCFVSGPLQCRANKGREHGGYLSLCRHYCPVYLLHQYEEHGHGAFKREVNRMLPPTFGRLTDQTIFVVNIPGAWGVDIAATYLARFVGPGAGLVAPYLAIVNGLIHVGVAVRTRRSNPGLWTSLLLLLPVGGAGPGDRPQCPRPPGRPRARPRGGRPPASADDSAHHAQPSAVATPSGTATLQRPRRRWAR